ncbi:MAG TPA: Ig-like domain-containing protein [Anaeromyxobacter sp.]
MRRSLRAWALALASVAASGCKIGGNETTTAGDAACTPVGSACGQNMDCCSYGCQAGICSPNPVDGGTCKTTDDCAFLRLCKSGACTTPTAGMCRDDADVCSSRYQCCSGDCLGARCTVNRPPVASAGADVPDAPYTKPFMLTNASSDPDGDPLTYGWSLVSAPAGSAAVLSSTTAATPTFTPDKPGPYVVRLVVTDGPAGVPNRLTAQTSVTITAVNRAPVATAAPPTATWSRNLPITISGTVTDPDGDTLECAWRVTEPGGATPPISGLSFAACANPSAPTFPGLVPAAEGLYQVDLVVRDHDRTTGAVVNTVLATASFTSVNDAPTPQVSRAPYYANVGSSGTTPPIALDASPSTDKNGDAPLSFFWEMVSASDGGALPPLTGEATATPSLVADRAADYVVRVTVSDPAQFGRASASASLDVTVRVGRYIQQLGHDVLDAARATAADKVVLGGHDPTDTSKGMVWVYDLVAGMEAAGIRLVDPANAAVSGIPRFVGVTPDGTKAVIVDSSVGIAIWIVNFGTTPTMSRIAAPWAVGDLVVASNRFAYLFKNTADDYVRELDLTTGTLTPKWSGYGAYGAAYTGGATPYIFRVDTLFGWWDRFAVNNNGASSTAAASSFSVPQCGFSDATAIWPTQNSTFASSYVISSCGDVYSASSLGSMAQNVGFSPYFIDSTANGSVLAVDSGGTTLRRLDASLAPQGTDALPAWADNEFGRTTYALRAFLNGAATKRFAVVRDTATPTRYGVITYP